VVDAREKYIASRAPRRKRTHPARSAQALNTSGAGIVHRNMMDLQRQPNLSGGDVDRLKSLRRDWNRNRKYTDAGMALAGATTPMDAQNAFMRDTETFRQLNKPAYNKMYPLTGMAMDYPSQGGLFGMIARGAGDLLGNLKGMGKDISDKVGITGAVDDTPEEQDDYVAKTFGFYPSDVHPGLPIEESLLVDEVPELTREEQIEKLLVDPGIRTDADFLLGLDDEQQKIDDEQKRIDDYYGKSEEGEMVFADAPLDESLPFDEGREDFIRRQNEYVAPIPATLGIPNPQGDFARFNEYPTPRISVEFGGDGEAPPPIIPFDDSGREAGIASLYGQGPQWGSTNRRYEKEYRDYVMSGGEQMDYDDFEIMYEESYQGKPHAGLR
jgi:hypothetical protein